MRPGEEQEAGADAHRRSVQKCVAGLGPRVPGVGLRRRAGCGLDRRRPEALKAGAPRFLGVLAEGLWRGVSPFQETRLGGGTPNRDDRVAH